MNSKTVIVTGGTGFVGANLVRRLVAEGHNVHLFVRREHNDWRLFDMLQHIHLHIVDLSDFDALRAQIGVVRPDWVFHLAAYGAYSWQSQLNHAIQTNFLGTVNLVEACRGVGFDVFVNTGSSSEYGSKDHAPLETDWLDPNSYYAMTKASATIYCQFAARHYNLNIPTLRLYSVFGPYEDRGRLIPSVITHGMNGELPPLVDPAICRDFVYVQDVENAYLHLATSQENLSGRIYNLGTGVQTSLRDVVDVATRVFSLSVRPQWGTMPNRSWDTTIWKANNDKLLQSGWVPEFNFETGFQRTVDWFNDHPEFRNYYLKTN